MGILNIFKMYYYLSLIWHRLQLKVLERAEIFVLALLLIQWRQPADFFLPPALPTVSTNGSEGILFRKEDPPAFKLKLGKIQSCWNSALAPKGKRTRRIRIPKSELRVSPDSTPKVLSFWLNHYWDMTTGNHWIGPNYPGLKGDSERAGTSGEKKFLDSTHSILHRVSAHKVW